MNEDSEASEQNLDVDGADAAQGPRYVYAIGKIVPRFGSLAIEHEMAHLVAQEDRAGRTDLEVMSDVLSAGGNRYLARQVTWNLRNLNGRTDLYTIYPRDPEDLDALIGAITAERGPDAIDVVIGLLGPKSPDGTSDVVWADKIYSFDLNELISSIPRPDDKEATSFDASAKELISRITQLGDNSGAQSEHRALNYLILRESTLYELVARKYAEDSTLSSLELVETAQPDGRELQTVILTFRNRRTNFEEEFYIVVDTTEEFPFTVTSLRQYLRKYP